MHFLKVLAVAFDIDQHRGKPPEWRSKPAARREQIERGIAAMRCDSHPCSRQPSVQHQDRS